ncbi:MAG: alpha/beta hydrolase [Acidobacteriota bacterium]
MSVRNYVPDVGLGQRYWKYYLRLFFPSLVVLIVTFLIINLFLTYRIVYPQPRPESGDPASYLLPFQELNFQGDGGQLSVWFIPGLKGSPAVFLCHDYGSNRIPLLNLAALLRETGYNVALMPFRGHGNSHFSYSTLGLEEGQDLSRAVDFVVDNLGVDESSVATYGISLGAHAAMRAALQNERIRVLVLDSPYPCPYDLIEHEIAESVGFNSSLLSSSVGLFSSLYLGTSPFALTEDVEVESLFPRPILYIAGLQTPSFARWTRRLYAESEGRKDILTLPRTRKSLLITTELRTYDQRIVNFLRQYLPL